MAKKTDKIVLTPTQITAAITAGKDAVETALLASNTRVEEWADIPVKIGVNAPARQWAAESKKTWRTKAEATFHQADVSRMMTAMSFPEAVKAAIKSVGDKMPKGLTKDTAKARDTALWALITVAKGQTGTAEGINLTPAIVKTAWTKKVGDKGVALTRTDLRNKPNKTNVRKHLETVFEGCPGLGEFVTACCDAAQMHLKPKPAEKKAPTSKAKAVAQKAKDAALKALAEQAIADLKGGKLRGAAKSRATALAALLDT